LGVTQLLVSLDTSYGEFMAKTAEVRAEPGFHVRILRPNGSIIEGDGVMAFVEGRNKEMIVGLGLGPDHAPVGSQIEVFRPETEIT